MELLPGGLAERGRTRACAGVDGVAVLGDLCADAVALLADVDAVEDAGLLRGSM
jgi:hypothetical protein